MINHLKTLVLAYKYLKPAKALRQLVSRDFCGEAGEVWLYMSCRQCMEVGSISKKH